MKLTNYILVFSLLFSFAFECSEDEVQEALEDERSNALVTFVHAGTATGCTGSDDAITFVVSYQEVQAFVDLDDGGSGFLNLSVVDGESVNVQVRRQSDDVLLADANVNVRTDSRPAELEDAARTITYCINFNLLFSNF